MNEESTFNNKANDEFTQINDNEEIDYKNLITRLKEINITIALLKNYLDKV